jgi:hypothetical protein
MKSLLMILALLAAPAALTSAQTPMVSATGKYSISGVVVSATTGQPLDRVDITLHAPQQGSLIAETTSGEDGRFVFEHLAAAKYSLSASRRGYIAANYDEHEGFSTAIVTGEGQATTGLRFRLSPQGVIGGVVTDDSGDPVTQARVSLYRQNTRNGLSNIVHAGTTITDDTGAYEFARLQPGNYFISVSATPWYATHSPSRRDAQGNVITTSTHLPLDVAYATTFYADVTDSDSATPIPVKPGDREPVNFALHAVPAIHLSLQVPAQRGDVPEMPSLRQEVFGSTDFVPTGMSYSGRGRDDGETTVEFDGLPPGHYEVALGGRRGLAEHVTSIDATSDARLDVSQSAQLAEVTGKVVMADGGHLPERMSMSMRSQDGRLVSTERAQSDGTFTLHGIAPGSYELVANAPGTALAVTQMTATGATADGHMLTVGTQAVTLSAKLAEGSTTVTGFAKHDGKPGAGVMVLLAPRNSKADSEMFRRDQSDSDGSFTMYRVVPGEYTLVAIEDGWTLDWAKPEVIAHYLPQGQKVTIPAHRRDMALPEAVEVQAK